MMNERLLEYARAKLDNKEVRQFERAISNPMVEFHNRVILPNHYRRDDNEYLAISDAEDIEGRNHYQSAAMTPDLWSAVTYFTNPLTIPPPPVRDEKTGKNVWVPPSQRTAMGQFQVMTYEFDEKTIEFFKVQLSWLRSKGKKLTDSPIGELYRHCSQWIDFEGITVAWSGNKSFHIHVVFSTAHAKSLGIGQHLRAGLMAHWRRLMPAVQDTLDTTVVPDMGMDQPEKYRRIPNGVRLLDKENILGIPAGQFVPQVTLWEMFHNRTPNRAKASFFDPSLFVERAPTRSYMAKSLTFLPFGDELEYCADRMRDHFNELSPPIFHGFTDGPEGIRAHFRNHTADSHPASYMEADYVTVNINGSNPLGMSPRTAAKLPKPLGEMLLEWSHEYENINCRPRSAAEKDFALKVRDRESGKKAIWDVMREAIKHCDRSFILAPEGISKSTSLFENHHRINLWVNESGDQRIMYAFADYENAYAKAKEFNAANVNRPFHAVVLRSFNQLYSEWIARARAAPVTVEQAAVGHCRNLFAAVEKYQPAAIDFFRAEHERLWSEVEDKKAVFFTVHAVAQKWPMSSMTRRMAAPSFWLTRGDPDHTEICRAETRLALLVHDEIKASDLVSAYPTEAVEWVSGMAAANPEAWDSRSNEIDRHLDFKAYQKLNPYPLDFATVCEIFDHDGHEWDRVEPRNSGEYGELAPDSIYQGAFKRPWSVRELSWPREAADRVLTLTTEAVPLSVAKHTTTGWTTFDLDTPLITPDVVTVIQERSATSAGLPDICADWLAAKPNLFVVSNKVAHLERTMTHASARGSNALIGRDIMQTMTFVSVAEFEQLEALNAWTGRGDLIRHRHIDEFNQTAGRNLGFRRRGKARHWLVVNRRLFSLLVGEPKARARYSMNVEMKDNQQRRARSAKKADALPESQRKLRRLRAALIMENINNDR